MIHAATHPHPSIARLTRAAAALHRPAAFMEVCGTHTVSACRSGLHSLMPDNVRLISGPGCPVCVTSTADIDLLLDLASRSASLATPSITICTYGDMLRVPGSRTARAGAAPSSLDHARADGADIRIIYSAMDAVKLAASSPARQVVFAAVGFETTAPATAAAILAAERLGLTNFTILASHKRIIPAMLALVDSGLAIDGFLCPGHVAVIIGETAFDPIAQRAGIPCVIAGFEPPQIAEGLARLLELCAAQRPVVENCYTEAVTPTGNPTALALLDKVFAIATVRWRGLGEIPDSGLVIRPRYALFDALVRYGLRPAAAPEPSGCRCGDVITGRCLPGECRMFAALCTPATPVGPCMVSSEGSCQAYFKYHRPRKKAQPRTAGAQSLNPSIPQCNQVPS